MIDTYQEQTVVIANILYLYSQEKHSTEIKDYYSHLHKEFFKLKKRYPAFFKRLFFDTNGHIPFSKELDSIIQDLQISGVVSKYNPGFNTLIIENNETKALIDKRKDIVSEIPDSQYRKMIKELHL
jgi:hypothetical protein